MNNEKIIIVEDELLVAKDLEKTLVDLGYSVIKTFSNGEDFLDEVESLQVDLIIMDIMLAGQLNGIETVDRFYQKHSVPVIFLTAYAEQEKIQQAKKLGPYGYLIKPYNKNELATTIEITLYKDKLYKELQQKEKRFETIINNSQNGVIITHKDGEPIYANARATLLFGNHNCTNNIRKLLTEEQWNTVYHSLFNNQIKKIEQVLHLAINGEEKIMEVNCALISDGTHPNMVFQFKDLTQDYHSQRQMKMLFTAISSIDECIYITNENHQLIYANQTFINKFQYNRQNVYNRNIFQLIFRNVDSELIETIKHVTETQSWIGDMELTTQKDQLVQSTLKLYKVIDQTVFYVGIIRDISEEIELKKQINQVQRLESIGKLAGGVAHDFNNLLSVINGYSELLLTKFDKESSEYDFLAEINGAGMRASDLTRQLLLFSKTQLGKIEKVNINNIILNITKMLKRVIGENIQLNIDLEEDLYTILADKGQIEQILMNLSVNARDAIHDNKSGSRKIDLKTENVFLNDDFVTKHFGVTNGEYVRLKVQDTGTGIPHDIQDKIFDPFFSTKGDEQGTGLGLSTVYGIVRKYEGIITLDSTPGEGTEFNIFFPKSNKPLEKKTQKKSTIKSGSARILIVEDSIPLLKLAEKMLRSLGYSTLSACKAEKAYEIAQQNKHTIDLVFTDLIMPDSDGYAIYNHLKEIIPGLKVLYTSGYDDKFLKCHNLAIEKDRFIRKPFARSEISQKLDEILNQ